MIIFSANRYGILTDKTWPHWNGDPRQGVVHVLQSMTLSSPSHYQIGVTKVFIKQPESVSSTIGFSQ